MRFLKRIWNWIFPKPVEVDWETDFLFGGNGLPVSYHTCYLKLDMDHFKGMKEAELVPKVWPEGYSLEGDVMKRDVFFHDVTWDDTNAYPPIICPTAILDEPRFHTGRDASAVK